MTDADELRSLAADLRSTRFFEDAASIALRSMLAVCDRALASSRYAERGRLVRGMVHLRPDDAYRRLWVEDHRNVLGPPSRPSSLAPSGPTLSRVASPPATVAPAAAAASDSHPPPASIETAYLPSATAFRWIAEHGVPIAIDVHAGLLHPDSSAHSSLPERVPDDAPLALGSDETRDRLLGRDATHVYMMPLRAPGGALAGMFSLEASCQSAMGRPFVWQACAQTLHLLAELAAPHLATLRLRPSPAVEPDELLPVVGASTAGLVQILRVFAHQEETILIGGPTGVGKSRLARYCHARSRRHARKFEVLDLLTLPEDLQMGELFGWKRGAFTGAIKDTLGAVARAEKGTLFIDEIDKLSLKAQAGLLRVIEERVYRPVGEGTGDHRADVRFLIGTNADLQAAVRAGTFREDLYYRINVLPVKVPPLEGRQDEIPAWAAYMLDRRHREGGGDGACTLTPDAERLLVATRWPGNLRQLDNIVRRAYALALVEYGESTGGAALQKRHFEQALAYEPRADVVSLLDALRAGARAFVRETERRAEAGSPLSLDLSGAFTGLVLLEAIEKTGGRDEAFRLLGRADLLENRNHHRFLHRELERAEALFEALGGNLAELAAVKRRAGS